FIITVGYSINYSIHDLESYYLLAYISGGIMACFAIRWIFDFVELFQKQPHIGWATLSIPVFMIFVNFSHVNQKENYQYADFTQAVLNSPEPGAVIFSRRWDTFVSPAYYFQHVGHLRSDVLIIDKELMRRSWYFDQLHRLRPEIMESVKGETDEFIKALMPFERGQKFNPGLIQEKFTQLITA